MKAAKNWFIALLIIVNVVLIISTIRVYQGEHNLNDIIICIVINISSIASGIPLYMKKV